MARRRRVGAIAFTMVWLVFWAAAILVAVWTLGAQALEGELVPALFLVVWVSAALYALTRVARTLVGRLAGGDTAPRRLPGRNYRWRDDLSDRPAADAPPPLPPDARGEAAPPMPRVPTARRRSDEPPPRS